MVKKILIACVSVVYLAHISGSVDGLQEAIVHSDVVKVQDLIKGLELSGTNKNARIEYYKTFLSLAQQVAQKREEQGIFKNRWDAASFVGGLSLLGLGAVGDVLFYIIYKEMHEEKVSAEAKRISYKRIIPVTAIATAIAAGGAWLAAKGWYCSKQQELQKRAVKVVQLLEERIK